VLKRARSSATTLPLSTTLLSHLLNTTHPSATLAHTATDATAVLHQPPTATKFAPDSEEREAREETAEASEEREEKEDTAVRLARLSATRNPFTRSFLRSKYSPR